MNKLELKVSVDELILLSLEFAKKIERKLIFKKVQ